MCTKGPLSAVRSLLLGRSGFSSRRWHCASGLMRPPPTVVVEGNIAAGKTALAQHLRRRLPQLLQCFDEPVDRWRNLPVGDGQTANTLALMYDDPQRWALAFQNYVQLTMLDLHSRPTTDGRIKLMERSIYSARACFVENLRNSGLMGSVDYAVLSEWFNWIRDNVRPRIDLIVYLRTEPSACLERILRRCLRKEENTISLEYLSSLHRLHEDWLLDDLQLWLPAGALPRVVTVDANGSPESVVALCERDVVPLIEQLAHTGRLDCTGDHVRIETASL